MDQMLDSAFLRFTFCLGSLLSSRAQAIVSTPPPGWTTIAGGSGEVIPPGEPGALAQAWRSLLDRLKYNPTGLRREARERIVERFSQEGMRRRTLGLFEELLRQGAENQPG